jgi:hypothetical protein
MLKDQENEISIGDAFDDELGEGDYGFILGPDGELKSVFIPHAADVTEVPESVIELLAMFGIDEFGGQRTLH